MTNTIRGQGFEITLSDEAQEMSRDTVNLLSRYAAQITSAMSISGDLIMSTEQHDRFREFAGLKPLKNKRSLRI